MNLYLVSQDRNSGYDTCDSMIVAARTKDAAKRIRPSFGWCDPEHVTAEFIGKAKARTKPGILLKSFNAG